jgi:hypothetical protein
MRHPFGEVEERLGLHGSRTRVTETDEQHKDEVVLVGAASDEHATDERRIQGVFVARQRIQRHRHVLRLFMIPSFRQTRIIQPVFAVLLPQLHQKVVKTKIQSVNRAF